MISMRDLFSLYIKTVRHLEDFKLNCNWLLEFYFSFLSAAAAADGFHYSGSGLK